MDSCPLGCTLNTVFITNTEIASRPPAIWKVFRCLSCPYQFISLVQGLHGIMTGTIFHQNYLKIFPIWRIKTRMRFGSNTLLPVPCSNCLPSDNLRVNIRYCYNRGSFNRARLRSQRLTRKQKLIELRYADYIASLSL